MSKLEDVARLAGVSTATASRALSRAQPVSHEAWVRVSSAAQALDYVPNMVAATLRLSRRLRRSPESTSPVPKSLLDELSRTARSHGYRLLTVANGRSGVILGLEADAKPNGVPLAMPLNSLRAWLGLDRDQDDSQPLRDTLQALDHLEPDRARYLAAFAYLLGRVAHADQHVSPEESRAMEALVQEQGQLASDQAALVVRLAQASHSMFGGTASFLVAREFREVASDEQKLALMRCLFALSTTDQTISTSEESEIHRIANELRLSPQDLIALRLQYRQHLPGMSRRVE